MRCVLTSKDGIFYEKRKVPDSAVLMESQLEVDEKTFLTIKIPCVLKNGVFESTDQMPEFFREVFYGEEKDFETFRTTEERVADLEEAMELLLSGATGEEVSADDV